MKHAARWVPLAPVLCLAAASAIAAVPSRRADLRPALRARALLGADGRYTGAPYQAALRARALMLRTQTSATAAALVHWTEIGPGNVGGRLNAVWIDPANARHLVAGSASGGLWQSNDDGSSWSAVSEFPGALTIGAITSLPNGTLLVGTGDAFTAGGDGIFSSSDAGASWTPQAATAPRSAGSFWELINSLAVSNGAILAATGPQGGGNGGIARSTDGGTSWTRVWTGSGTGAARGSSMDVAVDPNNGDDAVADDENGGVIFSTDGGQTWMPGSGLPDTPHARVSVAFDPSVRGSVYALVDNNNGARPSGQVYHSTDGGSTWSLLAPTRDFVDNSGAASGALCDRDGCQGWYDNVILVEPHARDASPTIIAGGIDVFASRNGGRSWTEIGGYAVGNLHPDQHALAYAPSSGTLYVGNDGGFYRQVGQSTWKEQNEGLAVTQLYSASGHRGTAAWQNLVNDAPITPILAGAQDNGTLLYEGYSGGGAPQPDDWVSFGAGDGGFTQVDPADGDDLYGEYVYLSLYHASRGGPPEEGYSPQPPDNTGKLANFIAPYALLPNGGAPATQMLAGGASLWLGGDIQSSSPLWTKVNGAGMPASSAGSNYVSAIAVDPTGGDDGWVGYDDGEVWYSPDLLGHPAAWSRSGAGVLPDRKVESLWIVPAEPGTVYATFGGYPSTSSGSNVWMTADGGATWTDIGSSLPAAPVYSLLTDPGDPQILYAGTLTGVYASPDDGHSWSTSSVGPANVEVRQLTWFDSSDVEAPTLLAATYGRGAWLGSTGYNPTPSLSSLSPSQVSAGSPSTSVDLTGSGFVQGLTTATVDGNPITVSYRSATELQATLPAAALSAAGEHTFVVANPSPGGGASAGATLTVVDAAPMSSSSATSVPPQKGGGGALGTLTLALLCGANLWASRRYLHRR